jgi:arylsulfatase A-like enzyme
MALAGLLGALLALASPPGPDGPAERPNVLILLTDDQRPDGVAALGNPAVRTPHLDALARRGLVFSNAYNLGANNAAVCQPSRNMLLSGRAYFRWRGPQAPASLPNLPDSFRAAGYESYHQGKRGNVAQQIQARFEHNSYIKEEVERSAGRPGRQIADDAISFLQARQADRPFLMYLAFEAPHDPRVPDPADLAPYDEAGPPLPANFLPLHPFDNGEMTVRDERLAPWPRQPCEIRRQLREYYAVITGLDRSIGRILATLEEQGLSDDTIIVFASDNGLALGSHGLMGKQSLYEHSAGVPLLLAGPGIAPGQSDALVYLHDLFPTLCDLAGLPVPDGLDGLSLAPVVRGERPGVRESLFTSYRDVQRAVRDDRFKLIRYPRINRTQLFDLSADPDELLDLSADPAQSERIARMMAELSSWQDRLGDGLALTSDTPADPAFHPPAGDGR